LTRSRSAGEPSRSVAIDKLEDVRPELLRAIAEVKKGPPAPVDTITRHR
jgi:hypothetical protein